MSFFLIENEIYKRKFINWNYIIKNRNELILYNEYTLIEYKNCYAYLRFSIFNKNFIIYLLEIFPKLQGCGTIILEKIRLDLFDFKINVNDPLDETLEFWYKMLKRGYIDYLSYEKNIHKFYNENDIIKIIENLSNHKIERYNYRIEKYLYKEEEIILKMKEILKEN